MIGINELLAKKAKYENEKIFLDAKIAVVDEFIAEEEAKCVEQVEEVAEENLCDEETIQ